MHYSELFKAAAWLISVLVYALIFGGPIPYFIFYTSLVLAAIGLILAFSGRWVSVTCSASVQTAQVGSKVRVEIKISNGSYLPVPLVQCCVAMPASFGLPDNTACYNISLAPGQERVISEEIECLTRGICSWGQSHLKTGDIFGFFSHTSENNHMQELTVLPEIIPLGIDIRTAAQAIPAGIRKYQTGDSILRIHWKASARTGSLLVKEFQDRKVRELIIFLDMHKDHHFGQGKEATSERAVTIAASLAYVGIKNGYAVGLVVWPGNHRTVIPPGCGYRQLDTILYGLAGVNPAVESAGRSLLADWIRPFGRMARIFYITGTLNEIESLNGYDIQVIRVKREEVKLCGLHYSSLF